MKSYKTIFLFSFLALISLCLFAAAGSALINLRSSGSSLASDWLSEEDKARLAEAIHLRRTAGEQLWPGWGTADIPILVYNQDWAFLVGLQEPAQGWIKVPAGIQRGGPWKQVPNDSFASAPYYRQPLQKGGETPQSFTVQVGSRWSASLQTLDWMKVSLERQVREDLPGFLQPVFPYPIFVSQLVKGDDQYLTLVAHESFHAYQGMVAGERLADSERSNQMHGASYTRAIDPMQDDWQAELDLLSQAVTNNSSTQAAELTRRFLEVRSERRERAGLPPELVEYEQEREWLEGLARYAELEVWRLASTGKTAPLAETAILEDFEAYSGFESRWSRELQQMKRMAGDKGDGRFYYTGAAQAYLLDRLVPDWKTRVFQEGVYLEDLLAAAVR